MGAWRSVYSQNPRRGSWLRGRQRRPLCARVRAVGARCSSSALSIAQGSGERHAGLDVHLHQARARLRERVEHARAQLLTPADLLHWVAAGALNPEQSAHTIARSATVTVAPQTLVSDCVLAMAIAFAVRRERAGDLARERKIEMTCLEAMA